jgi:RHS repeat-associated protein
MSSPNVRIRPGQRTTGARRRPAPAAADTRCSDSRADATPVLDVPLSCSPTIDMTSRRRRPARLLVRASLLAALLCSGALAAADAQTCVNAVSSAAVVSAIYGQVLDMGATSDQISGWNWQLDGGTLNVRQVVSAFAHGAEYRARFITGQPSRNVVTFLFRHLLAREPDDADLSTWVSVGESQGWDVVIDGLVNGAEYGSRFGAYVVPGDPVVAWDCSRATFVAAAHQGAYRDEMQGSATVSFTTPPYVSLNKPRSLTFTYSSGTARPTGLVEMNVVDNTSTPPARVSIQLKDVDDNAWLTPETFYLAGTGVTRVAAVFDAASRPSGSRAVWAVVRKYASGSSTAYSETVVGTRVSTVNERGSTFGAGWTLAGFQNLTPKSDGVYVTDGGVGQWFSLLGTDADGSRRYASPSGDFSTLRWNAPTGTYDRAYPDGKVVRFAERGRMVDATDRLGNQVWFGYDTSDRLVTVRDPVGKETTLGYTGSGALAWVQDPGGRRVTTTASGSVLWRFWQPDGTLALDLGLVQDAGGAWLLDNYWTPSGSRTAGAQTGWHVDYDNYGRMSALTAPEVTTDAGPARPVTTLASREVALLPTSGTGTFGSPASRGVPDSIRVRVTDPRGYVTRLTLNALGQQTRIEDALGNVTVIERAGRFSSRITKVDAPGGSSSNGSVPGAGPRNVSIAAYDGLGRVVWSTALNPLDDQVNDTTRYQYGNASWPYFATRVTSPTGIVDSMAYDAATGNRIWKQVGLDTLRRVRFGYNARGQVATMRSVAAAARGEAPELIEYDGSANVEAMVSPKGFRTSYLRDGLGQVTLTRSPIDSLQSTWQEQVVEYDVIGRDTLTRTYGPVDASGVEPATSDTVRVSKRYDAAGRLVKLTRSARPTRAGISAISTRWSYDALNRVVAEIAPGSEDTVAAYVATKVCDMSPSGTYEESYCWFESTQTTGVEDAGQRVRDSTAYDLNGNVSWVLTRTGDTLRTRYDALSRPLVHSYSARTYQPSRGGIPSTVSISGACSTTEFTAITRPYPAYPTNAAACTLTLPRDSAVFSYDAAGNVRQADNSDARVHRGYYSGGSLRADTLLVQNLERTGDAGHTYVLGFTYDPDGRVTQVAHPAGIAPASASVTGYTYDPITGALESVTDPLSNRFAYAYDFEGQLTALTTPTGNLERRYYHDADGRLSRTTAKVPAVQASDLNDTRFRYDARAKMLRSENVVGDQEWMEATYSALGQMTEYERNAVGLSQGVGQLYDTQKTSGATYVYDALGNIAQTGTTTYTNTGAGSPWYSFPLQPSQSSIGKTVGSSQYEPRTGRLIRTLSGRTISHYTYDSAGNQTAENDTTSNSGSFDYADRVSYYGGDGKLRAVDYRSKTGVGTPAYATWEDYRYDAFGRRIWVRTRKWCDGGAPYSECNYDTVRRTVWDGDQALYEIQMVDAAGERENDGTPTRQPVEPDGWDPNPLLGRALLTHGRGIDQPLSAIRMGYAEHVGNSGTIPWQTFAVIPLWDSRGRAPYMVFGNGQRTLASTNAPTLTLGTYWLLAWEAYGAVQNSRVANSARNQAVWMGTTMDDAHDASGLLYRRNRYYDPASGRFTQEDPVGLAGGVNLYGYANGDPVSYSDPYGLCADEGGDPPQDSSRVTTVEEKRLRCVAKHYTDQTVKETFLALLNAGQIYTGDELGSAFAWTAVQGPERIIFNSALLSHTHEMKLREVVAHEVGHVFQRRMGVTGFDIEIGSYKDFKYFREGGAERFAVRHIFTPQSGGVLGSAAEVCP